MGEASAELGCPRDKLRIVKIGLDLHDFPVRTSAASPPARRHAGGDGSWRRKASISLSERSRPRVRSSVRASSGSSETGLSVLSSRRSRPGSVSRTPCASSACFPTPTCRDVMQRASVCIQPSRTATDGDTEGGAPTVLLEMQAMGIPVVATRHADIPQVVCEPSELADEEMSTDSPALSSASPRCPGRLGPRAKRGRALVEAEHDARRIAMRVERLYDEALAAAFDLTRSAPCPTSPLSSATSRPGPDVFFRSTNRRPARSSRGTGSPDT